MSFRLKSKVTLALICILTLAGCTLLPAEEEPLKPPLVKPPQENYRTTPVEIRSIAQEVRGNGALESYYSEAMEFKLEGGRVKEVLVRAGDSVKKGDVLVRLDEGDMDIQLRALEINMLKSQAALKDAKLAADKDTLQIAQLQYEMDEIKYKRMRNAYADKQLIAEMDGLVTFVAPIAEGDLIQTYETIVTISDPTKLRFSFQIDTSSNAGKVAIGYNAALKFGNGKIVMGKVSQTPTSAPKSDNESLAERYSTHIYVEMTELPADAEIGDRADVSVMIQEKDDAIVIPRSGLRNYLGRTFVRILEDGNKIREIDVETGIVGSTEIEVTKGLEVGQLIVLQ